MSEPRAWRDRAACREVVTPDYDPFFADTPELIEAALAICAGCPVSEECLAFAVRTGQQAGVWGGRTQQEVRRLIALARHGRVPATHHNASKTHCKRGHPFDAQNTYYAPDGQRRCRTCLRDAQPIRAPRYLGGGGSDAA